MTVIDILQQYFELVSLSLLVLVADNFLSLI